MVQELGWSADSYNDLFAIPRHRTTLTYQVQHTVVLESPKSATQSIWLVRGYLVSPQDDTITHIRLPPQRLEHDAYSPLTQIQRASFNVLASLRYLDTLPQTIHTMCLCTQHILLLCPHLLSRQCNFVPIGEDGLDTDIFQRPPNPLTSVNGPPFSHLGSSRRLLLPNGSTPFDVVSGANEWDHAIVLDKVSCLLSIASS